jgi:tRNA-specific 2-thiouridylase
MRVAVGLSGGVDSAMAAALLKEAGHTVIGAIMRTWDGRRMADEPGRHGCYGPGEVEDVDAAERIAAHLDVPVHVLDLSGEYNTLVLDRCTGQYLAGLTPNPCVHCNRVMKFELIPARLRRMGIAFDRFATGHYAMVEQDATSGRFLLRRGRDRDKDQSYFLYQLTQDLLAQTLLPLGPYTKAEIRSRAADLELPVADKPESQDFVSGGYGALFTSPGRPGPILDEDGRQLGGHRGIEHYTVGQRRGLNISHTEPLYVLAIDERRNAIIVGPEHRLLRSDLEAVELNWIAIPELREPLRVQARIRYRHVPAPATVSPATVSPATVSPAGTVSAVGTGRVEVRFDEPQRAIAPGQAVVFYDGDLMVGGGIIAKPPAAM